MKDFVSEQTLVDFLHNWKFPEESECYLVAARQQLEDSPAINDLYTYIERYNGGDQSFLDYDTLSRLFGDIGEKTGIFNATVALLFFVSLLPHLHELYQQHGYSEQVFYDTVSDLKWKTLQTRQTYGNWGVGLGTWCEYIYGLKRFALGRLQFELFTSPFDYSKNGANIKAGDTVINVHIPACGPLLRELCLASYDKAAEFFKDSFKNRPIVFYCWTWLLDPNNEKILPPTSNVVQFLKDFDIVYSEEHDPIGSLGNIFNKTYQGNPDEMPQNTSMQRCFLKWIGQGGKVGWGKGFFVYQRNN